MFTLNYSSILFFVDGADFPTMGADFDKIFAVRQ